MAGHAADPVDQFGTQRRQETGQDAAGGDLGRPLREVSGEAIASVNGHCLLLRAGEAAEAQGCNVNDIRRSIPDALTVTNHEQDEPQWNVVCGRWPKSGVCDIIPS